MAASLDALLLHWNRSVASTRSDGDLLRSYLQNRAEEPFRLLVERHGRMVLGVCRHRLGDAHAAEDAFQATFLLLARRAGSIRRPESVAAWLHRTAIRVCGKARCAEMRRRSRELPLTDFAASEDSHSASRSTSDVLLALEEEVERLPERYRTPLLLCYWQGMTQAEAARSLGCSEGSVKARLERGRKRLAQRLTQRGLAPHAVLVAPLAAAMVPRELLARTIVFAPKEVAVPAAVATLTKGMSPAFASWAKYALGALVTAAALTFGAGVTRVLQRGEAPPQPAAPQAERKPAATPLPEGAIARIGSPRLRHAGEVAAMAFSTDGRWLASASPHDYDRSVRVWDLTDGTEKLRVPIVVNPNENYVLHRAVAVSFSKDGRQLRVIDFDSYRVIDRATGRQVLQHRFHEKAPQPGLMDASHVIGATFSADMSTYAAIRRNGELILGDAATGKIRRTIAQVFVVQQNQFYSYVSVILSGDGRRVCVPLYSDPTKIIDTATGKVIRTLSLKQQGNWASAFLKGGDEFAYLAQDGARPTVQVINVADGKKVRQIPVEFSAICLDVSPNGELLAVGNTQRLCIQMFDLLTGKEIRRIPRSPSESRLIFSPDSKRLASISYSSGSVTVWETASGKRVASSADGVEYTRGFDRDGRLVVCVDGRNQITDWKTGRVFGELPIWSRGLNFVTYSPDHRLKAYQDMSKPEDWKPEKRFPISVRDVATDKEISRLIGNKDFCVQKIFTNDSKGFLTISQDAMIRLWDIVTGKELWSEKLPAGIRYRGSGEPYLSADDRRLAILSPRSDREMELRVWDLAAKRRIAAIPTPYLFFGGISFSPDGKFIAGGGNDRAANSEDNGAVFVWDVDAGKLCRKLAGHLPGEISCRFAPDGRTLATVDPTGLIRIWELATGQERFRITGHHGRAVAHFSPDSALIAGWSNDAPILIWDIYGLSHSPKSLDTEKEWQALADGNAARAFTAIRRLRAAPVQAVKLSREKLKQIEKVDAETVRKRIAQLDDDDFATRETAQKSLAKLGERAGDNLRTALQQSPSAEAKARLKRLVAALDVPLTLDQIRRLRAVEVLERIGSAEAKAILADIAQGAPGARLTIAAKASMSRSHAPRGNAR